MRGKLESSMLRKLFFYHSQDNESFPINPLLIDIYYTIYTTNNDAATCSNYKAPDRQHTTHDTPLLSNPCCVRWRRICKLISNHLGVTSSLLPSYPQPIRNDTAGICAHCTGIASGVVLVGSAIASTTASGRVDDVRYKSTC